MADSCRGERRWFGLFLSKKKKTKKKQEGHTEKEKIGKDIRVI